VQQTASPRIQLYGFNSGPTVRGYLHNPAWFDEPGLTEGELWYSCCPTTACSDSTRRGATPKPTIPRTGPVQHQGLAGFLQEPMPPLLGHRHGQRWDYSIMAGLLTVQSSSPRAYPTGVASKWLTSKATPDAGGLPGHRAKTDSAHAPISSSKRGRTQAEAALPHSRVTFGRTIRPGPDTANEGQWSSWRSLKAATRALSRKGRDAPHGRKARQGRSNGVQAGWQGRQRRLSGNSAPGPSRPTLRG